MSDFVINVTKDNYEDTVATGVVVLDFWAAWCGPCRMIAPIIEELAKDNEGKAKICKVNVDEEQELAQKHSVRSIPTLVFMKDGKIIEGIVGARSKSDLQEKINTLLK